MKHERKNDGVCLLSIPVQYHCTCGSSHTEEEFAQFAVNETSTTIGVRCRARRRRMTDTEIAEIRMLMVDCVRHAQCSSLPAHAQAWRGIAARLAALLPKVETLEEAVSEFVDVFGGCFRGREAVLCGSDWIDRLRAALSRRLKERGEG